MKKNYYMVLVALFSFALNAFAQEDKWETVTSPDATEAQGNAYNMVITLPDGTTFTVNTDDVDEVQFSNGQVSVSGTSIQQLLDYMLAVKTMNDSIDSINDQIGILNKQVGLLEGSLAVATAASITHFEMAKKYADEQVRLLELRNTNYVQDYVAIQLAAYLANHPDIDISKYASKDELNTRLQNYATLAQINSLATDVNARLGQLGERSIDMLNTDAALQTAINNLTKDVLQNGITIIDLKDRQAVLESILNTFMDEDLISKVSDLKDDIGILQNAIMTLTERVQKLESK